MAFAKRPPDGGILRTEKRDDRRADGRGNVHRTAVVAEQHVELREQGGELTHGERAVEGDEMGLGLLPDLVHQWLLGRTGHEEDLDAAFVLQPVADGGETLRGPDSGGTTAARVNENSRLAVGA